MSYERKNFKVGSCGLNKLKDMTLKEFIKKIDEVENKYLNKEKVLSVLKVINKDVSKKEIMNENIVSYMERWCLGRDEDIESLKRIKKELIKNNYLLWHK